VADAARAAERFGAQGITVHPRPDGRHIRYVDVRELAGLVTTEFNIEGNPVGSFVDLVLDVRPTQVTLVPDAVDALTSNAGWDTVTHAGFLRDVVARFRAAGIRVSVFVDPDPRMVAGAAAVGADRVELYTEAYAKGYEAAAVHGDEAARVAAREAARVAAREAAVAPYIAAAEEARRQGLGLNAGHDLNLDNLRYFVQSIPWTDEVSIGHALISDAIYLGLENTIHRYLEQLQ
jgi:pyridoxine 5-phosphate synthase